MDEHSWKAHKWKFITAVIVAVIGGLFTIFVAFIERTPEASSTMSANSTTTSPASSPAPITTQPAPSEHSPPPPAPTKSEPEAGPQALPYQWLDVTPRGDVTDARVYMLPPAGPQSNFVEIGGVGFPGNSEVRIEERTGGRRFQPVMVDGTFVAAFTSPGDCQDYVVSVLTEAGEHLADLRYDTQC
ncbi:MAG: hypothetical protein ABWY04_08560 [Arthrobacter sp.]